jgi:hypothetical protein
MRSLAFNGKSGIRLPASAKALLAAGSIALSACGAAPAKQHVPVVVIAEPPAHEQAGPSISFNVPLQETEMTMLKVGDTFLAYVSVPEGGSWHDLDDAKSSFFFTEPGSGWKPVPGCESVASCDLSGVLRSRPWGVSVKASFSADGYAPSSAEYTIMHDAGPFISAP